MKLTILGDIHGRSTWKDIVKKERDSDLFIFIGDYFDSFDISVDEQIRNFNEIIKFKEENSNNVILLLGNHDYHYLPYVSETYSGYELKTKMLIQYTLESLVKNKIIQLVFNIDNFLFSHAGISKTWLKNNTGINKIISKIHDDFEELNSLIHNKPKSLGFTVGPKFDKLGNETCQTPIWIRPEALKLDKIDGYIQIVGHTEVPEITIENNIVCIDSLKNNNYLIINKGELILEKL